MNIKLSIIIPIYNVEKYLNQCLNTVINQTLKDIEILCINDGSTDSSKEIIEDYKKLDKRVISITKPNGGYGSTCNLGLKASRGEYVAILEPDDFIHPDMYFDLYDIAKKNDCDIVKSQFYEYWDNDEKSGEKISLIDWPQLNSAINRTFKIYDFPELFDIHPSIWSCIYKKKFLSQNNIWFVEAKGAGWVDNPFLAETLLRAQKIRFTKNAYYFYRQTNPGSSSNIVNIANPFDRSEEIYVFLKKNNIVDQNIWAYLYKHHIGYIETVLSGICDDRFDEAYERIYKMVNSWDKNIINNNKIIDDLEKEFFNKCLEKEQTYKLMQEIKINTINAPIVR